MELSSKKGVALLAMLATSESGQRSRAWLQQKLWGSRDTAQAQASLRRELSNLRTQVFEGRPCLIASHQSVRLDLEMVDLDIRSNHFQQFGAGEFLEGIDIPGEEDFEDWLREMRGYFRHRMGDARPHSSGSQALVAPADPQEFLPMVAVLPARGLFGAPEDEALLVGLTRFLVDSLSRMRWLPVIAPETSHAVSSGTSASELARLVCARYVVELEFNQSAAGALLSFALVEMPSRRIMCSDSEKVSSTPQLDELQTAIQRATNIVAHTVDRAEQYRSLAISNDRSNLTALLWRIRHHLHKFTREDMQFAANYIREASLISPEDPELMVLKVHHAMWSFWQRRAPIRECATIMPQVRAAIRSDPSDARPWMFAGVLESWSRNAPKGIRHLEHSCTLDPSFQPAHAHLGTAYYLDGQPEKAIMSLQRALYLSPMDPFRFFVLGELATSRMMLGEYEEALRLAREIQLTHPNYVIAHLIEIGALVELNQHADACEVHDRLLRDRPDFAEAVLRWVPFREPGWISILRRGYDMVSQMNSAPVRSIHFAGTG